MLPQGIQRPMQVQPSLGAMVANLLREMITNGQFEPGEHLKEAAIADAMSVSRGPVREAFTQLEAEGYVELRRHRGAFVAALTRVDVDEVHTLRGAIERLAAERACTRMGAAEFARMDEVLEQMKAVDTTIEPDGAVVLDLAFHDIVYASCDHARVQRVWESIRGQVRLFLRARNINFPDFSEVGYPEHRELRDALAEGDPEVARAAVDKHILGAYERLRRLDLP